jgi:thymidylate synthase
MNPAFALAEVVWILNGRDDAAFLNFFNSRLPKFAGPGSTYHGAYGRRLRRFGGVDQLRRAAAALRARPETRQVVLQIWNSPIDLPRRDGSPTAMDIPCNICSLLKVREGLLEWTQVCRSNDVFLGLPHNIVQFTTLQEVVAGWIGIEPGPYNQLSDSLHAYCSDLPSLRLTSRKPIPVGNPDRFSLPERESNGVFRELAKRTEKCISAKSEVALRSVSYIDAPQAYQNVLCVLAAEASRRHGWRNLSDETMTRCSNPVYVRLWASWIERIARENRSAKGRIVD